MSGGLKLAPLLTEVRVDVDGFKNDMAMIGEIGVSQAKNISKTGDMLTKGLTIPLGAAAIASGKMAVDFESSFAKVSTLLDSNVVEFGSYKNQILDASSQSKIAVGDFSEAVYQSISAGVDQTKAIGFTTEAMKLAKGGFTDGASAVDILTTAINAYGLSANDVTKVSDMLVTTQNLGKTTVNELASNMGKAIPTANSYNVNLANVSAALADLTKNGIATAEATTYYNSMLNELGKSGTKASDTFKKELGASFADLMAQGVPLTDCLKLLKDKAVESGNSLGDMFGSAEAAKAALTIMKDDGVEYNKLLAQMENSAGATQTAFEKIDATPAEQLKGALNELRNAGIKFGAAFVPVIEKAANVISKVADSFSDLSGEQQKNIIKWGAVLMAIGPVMKVAGGTISTFAKLSSVMTGVGTTVGTAGGTVGIIGGFSGLLGILAPVAVGVAAVGAAAYTSNEYMQLMDRSVLESKEELGGMEKVLAHLTDTEVRSREELEKLGLVHKELSNELSPEFQAAIEKSTESVQEFSVFLSEIGIDGIFSDEESAQFSSRVTSMCDDAIGAIQSKKEESQASLKEVFVVGDGVIDEGEQKVLDILSKSSDAQVAEIQSLNARIMEIQQAAINEKRVLNEAEKEEINQHYAKMSQIKLEATSKSQEEIEYAQTEFGLRIETMSAKAASKLLQQKAKARDEEVKQTTDMYDKQIETLKVHAEQLSGEEKKLVEDRIAILESSKQEKIKSEKDLWDQYLKIVQEKNPAIVDEIDKYNGKILTNADKKNQKELETMKTYYEGLGNITESGCYEIYNTTLARTEDVAVVIDEYTGEITSMYSRSFGTVGGYNEEMGKSAEKMAIRQKDSFELVCSAMTTFIDGEGNIITKNGETIGSLNDLTEATDGSRSGIININGTPYNISVNSYGTIESLNAIGSAADEAAKPRDLVITAKTVGSVSGGALGAINKARASSNFNGLDYVPYDGYYARLHKGERVLTAEENSEFASNSSMTQPQNVTVVVNLTGKEVRREVVPLFDEELGKLIGRST